MRHVPWHIWLFCYGGSGLAGFSIGASLDMPWWISLIFGFGFILLFLALVYVLDSVKKYIRNRNINIQKIRGKISRNDRTKQTGRR